MGEVLLQECSLGERRECWIVYKKGDLHLDVCLFVHHHSLTTSTFIHCKNFRSLSQSLNTYCILSSYSKLPSHPTTKMKTTILTTLLALTRYIHTFSLLCMVRSLLTNIQQHHPCRLSHPPPNRLDRLYMSTPAEQRQDGAAVRAKHLQE